MSMGNGAPQLSLETLRAEIVTGEIDTVIVAFTDMQGRLQGKRLHGQFSLDHVLGHGTEGCNYLLAVDVEMNTVDGYAMSSWETGYGDFEFVLDMSTLRRTPGQPHSATIQCDLAWLDGSGPVRPSPRDFLKAQTARAAALGYRALAGTELEFIVFENSYDDAWDRGYRGLTGANRYNVDYSILGGTRGEPLLRDIRNEMFRAGVVVEGAKGECNLGQHEIAFLYDEVVRTCDNHVIYKTAAKELAVAHGQSITFMAKYDQREGNSCHIHLSLRGLDGSIAFADKRRKGGQSKVFDQFLAGVQATMREFSYFYAPNLNSYKRFQPGSFAPTAIAWGRDNRTCALRVVGQGAGLRMENRVPGGDVNPYLAVEHARRWPPWHRERTRSSRLSSAMRMPRTSPTCPPLWPRRATCSPVGHCAGRVRGRRRRPLCQRGRYRYRRLQCRRHGLGTRPWLRAALRPTREST